MSRDFKSQDTTSWLRRTGLFGYGRHLDVHHILGNTVSASVNHQFLHSPIALVLLSHDIKLLIESRSLLISILVSERIRLWRTEESKSRVDLTVGLVALEIKKRSLNMTVVAILSWAMLKVVFGNCSGSALLEFNSADQISLLGDEIHEILQNVQNLPDLLKSHPILQGFGLLLYLVLVLLNEVRDELQLSRVLLVDSLSTGSVHIAVALDQVLNLSHLAFVLGLRGLRSVRIRDAVVLKLLL